MIRLARIAAFALLAALPAAAASGRCAAAQALVADLAARGLFQGAFVLGLGDGERCEGAHGHADVERAPPFTPRTASDGGSIAKTMTAAAILRLAAAKKVDLGNSAFLRTRGDLAALS